MKQRAVARRLAVRFSAIAAYMLVFEREPSLVRSLSESSGEGLLAIFLGTGISGQSDGRLRAQNDVRSALAETVPIRSGLRPCDNGLHIAESVAARSRTVRAADVALE